jgi:hypothetical protein
MPEQYTVPVQIPAIDSNNVAASLSGTVTSATAVVLDTSDMAYPLTVTIKCPSATTGTLEFSTTPQAYANAGTANWQFWPSGTVAASTAVTDVFNGRLMALRISRASGSGAVIYEVTA